MSYDSAPLDALASLSLIVRMTGLDEATVMTSLAGCVVDLPYFGDVDLWPDPEQLAASVVVCGCHGDSARLPQMWTRNDPEGPGHDVLLLLARVAAHVRDNPSVISWLASTRRGVAVELLDAGAPGWTASQTALRYYGRAAPEEFAGEVLQRDLDNDAIAHVLVDAREGRLLPCLQLWANHVPRLSARDRTTLLVRLAAARIRRGFVWTPEDWERWVVPDLSRVAVRPRWSRYCPTRVPAWPPKPDERALDVPLRTLVVVAVERQTDDVVEGVPWWLTGAALANALGPDPHRWQSFARVADGFGGTVAEALTLTALDG